ncbi:cell division protein FtsQ/DivIB [Actinomycetaceae bacterium L2_0104]
MKPPKRVGKPRRLATPPQRQDGEDTRSERLDNLRQDAIPTAALSPDEAQALADWPSEPSARSTREKRGKALTRGGSEVAPPKAQPELPRTWAEDSLQADPPEEFEEIISEKPAHLSVRRREKLAERRRVHIKRIVAIVGSVLAIGLLVWVLFFSSLLAVRQDKIAISGLEGSETLTSAQVSDAMQPWVGTPVLRLDGGDIEERLVGEFSLIKSVDVSRDFPNGVSLDIALREPVACLADGDSCVAIDTEGVRLDLPAEQANALPRLALAPGQDEAGEAASAMIDVLEALPEQTRERVASIEVSETAQVKLTLSDGAVVLWGGSEENDFKAQVLSVLLQQPATTYDVSAPTAPVTS